MAKKNFTEKEVVENLQKATIEVKIQYDALMEKMKELQEIAGSVGYEISFSNGKVKKKTIVKLLH